MAMWEADVIRDVNSETYKHIGDIAKQLNISARSIRYYEELGMIVPKRSNGGYREYSTTEVEKITIIIKLKKLGLSLEEIQKFICTKKSSGKNSSAQDLLPYLHKRLHEFEDKIREYREGIEEINSVINIIENCGGCKDSAGRFKCEECLKEQDKEMPQLMKAML